jgi:hypothetical protein
MLQTSYTNMFVNQLVHPDIMVTKMEEFVLNVTLCVLNVSVIQMVTVLIVNTVGSLMDILVSKFAQLVNMPTNP